MSLELIFNILPFLRRDLPDKRINENYLDTSGIRNAAKSEGSRLSWASCENVSVLLLNGYTYVYERHRWWWRRKLVNRSGQVLLKRP
jgi:hypothetical protein